MHSERAGTKGREGKRLNPVHEQCECVGVGVGVGRGQGGLLPLGLEWKRGESIARDL